MILHNVGLARMKLKHVVLARMKLKWTHYADVLGGILLVATAVPPFRLKTADLWNDCPTYSIVGRALRGHLSWQKDAVCC